MANHNEINASTMDNEDKAWVINSIEKAKPPPPFPQIRRVPNTLRVTMGYEKELDPVERLKPVFTKELLSHYDVGLSSLYEVLGEVVQMLRAFYEEGSTDYLSDREFTRMMLLDACFILYYIQFIRWQNIHQCSRELRSSQIAFVQQDLFLLENQIPFEVLNVVMELIEFDGRDQVEHFIHENSILAGVTLSGANLGFSLGNDSTQNDQNQNSGRESKESFKFVADHLLRRLHSSLIIDGPKKTSTEHKYHKRLYRYDFRSLKQLQAVGIHFKSSHVKSLAHVEFVGRRWWVFSTDVKLPSMKVDDSTKTTLLNLIAYGMCVDDRYLWVTSYLCFLDSLIENPEDVTALRKVGVLDISNRSDIEVAKMLNEIATDLVPHNLAYWEAKTKIQSHFNNWKNTRLSQLIHEYVDWSILATFGAVMALFLSAVQTYFTVGVPRVNVMISACF